MFEQVEYQTEDLVSNFRDGVIYHYVGYTFLNGYINYIDRLKVCLLERYRTQGEKYEEEIWKPFVEKKEFHTKLCNLQDDILILGKTRNHYYFFWFDCDVSDCAIGRKKINGLNDKIMIKWFDNYVEELIEPKFKDIEIKIENYLIKLMNVLKG